MPLLLDTYNILHVTGVLPPDLAGIDVAELAQLIRASRYRAQQAMLVCDGDKHADVKAGRSGSITIRFAGKGRSADDLIAELVQRSTTPRRLIVVSSDHAVLKAARRRKCKTLTSEEFLKHIVADVRHRMTLRLRPRPRMKKPPAASKTDSASTNQVDKWIKLFDIDEAAVNAEAAKAMEFDPPESDAEEETASRTTEESSPSTSEGKQPAKRIPITRAEKRNNRRRPLPIADDQEPPPAVLPDDLVAEAERMLQQAMTGQPHSRGSGNSKEK